MLENTGQGIKLSHNLNKNKKECNYKKNYIGQMALQMWDNFMPHPYHLYNGKEYYPTYIYIYVG